MKAKNIFKSFAVLFCLIVGCSLISCGEEELQELPKVDTVCREHVDKDSDHLCDTCHELYTEHIDSNKDYKCDICDQTYFENNCKLIVGGKDVSTKYYAHIENAETRDIALPITAIARELGADIYYSSYDNTIKIKGVDGVVFDLNDSSFGWPKVEVSYFVREVINGEIVVDYTTILSILPRFFNIKTVFDKESSTIYAYIPEDVWQNGSDPMDNVNCKLIVNGEDITDGNYVRIDHDLEQAEIPLLAVFEALGAEVVKTEELYEINIGSHAVKIYPEKEDFGIIERSYPQVRQKVNGDFIIDCSYRLLDLTFINCDIDYENGIVYITDTGDFWNSLNPMDYSNARLVVNGMDITEGNFTRIPEYSKNAALPIGAIVKALGGDVVYDNKNNTVKYTVNGKELLLQFDEYLWGLDPDKTVVGKIREEIEPKNSIIVDSDSLSATLDAWGVRVEVDRDNLTVSIYSK